MNILDIMEAYPIAGSMILVSMLIVQQFFNRKSGKNYASTVQQETNRLTRQTSETVNKCSEKTAKVMESNIELLDAIDKHLEKNDLRLLSTQLFNAIQMLEKMADHQSQCLGTLDRVGSLVRSIADDIQKTDSRLVHEQINNKVHSVESLVEDIKRILVTK